MLAPLLPPAGPRLPCGARPDACFRLCTCLYKYFFRGLITVLPLALTVYLLYIFLAWTEAVALTFLRPFIGGFYVPGMGLALGILGILLIGYLVSKGASSAS